MYVAVNQVKRLKQLHEPYKRTKPEVTRIDSVVYAAGGRVRYKNIKVTAVPEPVIQQPRQQSENPAAHLSFGELIIPGIISHAAA
jgi:hypothetical protein